MDKDELVKLLEKANARHHPHSGECITCELIAALTAQQPQAAHQHKWGRDGERCEKCGDKDWMGGFCSVPDTAPPSGQREGMLQAAVIASEEIEKYSGNRACALYVRNAIRAEAEKLPQSHVPEPVEPNGAIIAAEIEALVEKTDNLIAYIGATGGISRNKINEIQIIDDVLDALAALEERK